jgi:hypothetical protein
LLGRGEKEKREIKTCKSMYVYHTLATQLADRRALERGGRELESVVAFPPLFPFLVF